MKLLSNSENLVIKLKSKIKQFEKGKIFISSNIKDLDIADYILEDREDEIENQFMEDLEQGDIYTPDDFDKNFKKKLLNDYEILQSLFDQWKDIKDDPKYDLFLDKLENEFFSKDINLQGKIVVFSESKVTTDYLVKRLKNDGFKKVLSIDGSNRVKLKRVLQSEFDQNYEGVQTNNYNILISTEVLAEGINLHRSNLVINYDTPWNSTRLIQRIGRVNRIGTKAKKVHVYNFFPTSNVEGDINLEQKHF